MKKGFFAIIVIAAVCVTGCVSTVTEEKTAGLKLSTDQLENRYPYSLSQTFDAAKRALQSLGQVSRESTLLESTNQVRTLEGKANGNDVWIRVEALQPKVTSVKVQARSTWSGSDVQTAHDVATRVALELSR
jgi:ABC-type oligopeptide transport system substrate-binding subunit